MKNLKKALFRSGSIRKMIAVTAFCAIGTSTFAQMGEIRRVTEPEYASGYVGWLAEVEVDEYVINILHDDGSGIVTTLSTITTSDLYTYIDPSLFAIGDTGYEILGKNANGEIINDSGEVWPAIQDELGTEVMCTKTCIGTTYAWKLTCYGEITSQTPNGEGGFTNTIGNRYLKLGNAFQYYDNSTGDFTPHWQAVSDNGYLNMIQNSHPYTAQYTYQQMSDGSFHYGGYAQESLDNLTQGGPFYDANGFALTDGRIIQKKLDQFTGFNDVSTSQSSMFNSCHFNTQGWINFFNLHETADMSSWPANLTWFNGGTTPTDLACNSSTPAGGGGNGGTLGGGPSGWWKDLYKKVELSSDLVNNGGDGITWADFVKHHEDILTVGGGTEPTIVDISIKSLTTEGVEVGMERFRNTELRLTRSKGQLTSGLYQVTLYTDDGNAVLSYYGIDFNMPQADMSEFVVMTVNPNPIEGGEINVSMDITSAISGQLIIHDINGNILHTESINEPIGQFDRTVIVQTAMVQLFVSLVLADGSLAQVQILNL